jgi:hypothetical protein
VLLQYHETFQRSFDERSCNNEQQTEYLQHELESALNYVCLADLKQGMMGATPTETMPAGRKSHLQLILMAE